jgi:hypothetical protein
MHLSVVGSKNFPFHSCSLMSAHVSQQYPVKTQTSMRCRGLHACISIVHDRQNSSPPKQSSHRTLGALLQKRHLRHNSLSPQPSKRRSSNRNVSRSSSHLYKGSSYHVNDKPVDHQHHCKSTYFNHSWTSRRRGTRFVGVQIMNIGWVKVWILEGIGSERGWFFIPVIIIVIVICRSSLRW